MTGCSIPLTSQSTLISLALTYNPLNPNTKKLNSHLFLQKYWGEVVEVFQSRFIFYDHVFNSHYHAVL